MITWQWGFETNVVFFDHMSQHELSSITDWWIWSDGAIMTWNTANHMDIALITVCCSKKNYMVSPFSILRHLMKILCPWCKTIYKDSKLSAICLQEYKGSVNTVTVIKVLCFGLVRKTTFVKCYGEDWKSIWKVTLSGKWKFSLPLSYWGMDRGGRE